MTRCAYCHRFILPWQAIGWLVHDSGRIEWHGKCRRLAVGR